MAGARLGVRIDPPRLRQRTMELLAGIGYGAKQIEALRDTRAIA